MPASESEVPAVGATRATPASALLDGSADNGHYPFVGTVIQDLEQPGSPEPETVTGGTGALLSPRVVLLAAHIGEHIPGWPAVGWGFTVDPNPGFHPDPALYGPGGQKRINGTIVRPSGWPQDDERDYALMVLDEPVPGVDRFAQLPEAGLLDKVVEDGTGPPLTIVGYGLAGEEALTGAQLAESPAPEAEPRARLSYLQEHTAGVRRVGTQTFVAPDAITFPCFRRFADPTRWLWTEGAPSVARHGDSGSPVFFPDSRQVLGVVATIGCERDGHTIFHRIDMPEVLEWIAETMDRFKEGDNHQSGTR